MTRGIDRLPQIKVQNHRIVLVKEELTLAIQAIDSISGVPALQSLYRLIPHRSATPC
jgi:hypothetical protein